MKSIIKRIIFIYQKLISPLLGKNCRFYPTCSEYALMCIDKYGVLLGSLKTLLRILKCHPLHPGGIDLP